MNVGELISLLSEMPAQAGVLFYGDDDYYDDVVEIRLNSEGDVEIR